MILTLISFSLLSLILSIVYFSLIKRGFSLYFLKAIIIIVFLITFILTVFHLIIFLEKSPNDILLEFDANLLYILLFNASIIIFGSSFISYIFIFLYSIENKTCKILKPPPSLSLSKRKNYVKIGLIKRKFSLKNHYYASLKDLEKHMFICGSTGTGKSNFMQYFLINLNQKYEIPFFLVEFKGEYHFLQNHIKNVMILWPGENFSVNIFNPEGANPFIHAERIFDILKSGKFFEDYSEFSPQMEKVLIEILAETCGESQNQNWEGFKKISEDYLDQNKYDIPMLKQTLIGVNNRIRRYSDGPLKAIFKPEKSINIHQIFTSNIILDLSSIIRLGGEKEDALFFLNMILKYLWDRNLACGANKKGIKHITIIEDAQYFAPQGLIKKSKLTTYLEDIALLQRGTGECLITLATRPDISKEILANNGIVLTFKNHIEKEIMCDLLNLDLENKNLLSSLNEGECIIRLNSIKEPFILKIPLLKREILTVQEINENNKAIFNKFNHNNKANKVEYQIAAKKQSKYQIFSDLIEILYKNQEKEKFLESKEHS